MTDEDRAAHDKFSQALIQDLAPEGAMETQLAQRIATDSWRLNRISAIEDNLFALGLHEHGGQLCPDDEQIDAALTTARVFTMESKQLQLLTLYEQRLNRSLQKNLALLQSLQAARKAEREAGNEGSGQPPETQRNERLGISTRRTMGSFFRMTKSTPPSTASSASSEPHPWISADTSPANSTRRSPDPRQFWNLWGSHSWLQPPFRRPDTLKSLSAGRKARPTANY